MRQLTSLDAQFLAMETARTYGHVGGLAVYDPSTAPGGGVEIRDVCRLVGERLDLLPPFRWKLAEVPFGLDHPYWVEDPDFDLDFHIRETALAPPGGERKLAEQIARIFSRPLDRSRPLWELWLIHGLDEGRVGMLTKVHHAAVDGVSGAEILGVLLDTSPEGEEKPPPREDMRLPARRPSQLEMLARGAAGLPRQPLRAVGALPGTLPWLDDLPGVPAVPGMGLVGAAAARARRLLRGEGEVLERPGRDVRVPRTRFNQPVSAHRRYAFGSLSLDAVKAIKNTLGITVNDVVVGVCATMLREWLLERDELPEDPLVAMVPVSVRRPEQYGTWGNKVSMMIVPIPSDEPDPRRRLERTHEVLRGAKERHRALPAELMQDATQFVPPAVQALASRTAMRIMAGPLRPPLNVVISNVPGPREWLFCAGARLHAHYPVSVITDGVGLNITVMSYRDHLDFGIVADREQVDDVWPMMDGLKAALCELAELVPVRERARLEGELERPEALV